MLYILKDQMTKGNELPDENKEIIKTNILF